MKKRTLIITLSTLIIAIAAVGTTLAYFTDTDAVTNSFTLGNVSMELTEDLWALPVGQDAMKVMPGTVTPKDPTITIKDGSESAWVFIKVEVSDAAALQAAVDAANTTATDLLPGIATSLAPSSWVLMGTPSVSGDVKTYYYGYSSIVAANESTSAIFTAITLPGTVDGSTTYASLNDGFTITSTGYAIQSANVTDLTAAYNIGVSTFSFPALP